MVFHALKKGCGVRFGHPEPDRSASAVVGRTILSSAGAGSGAPRTLCSDQRAGAADRAPTATLRLSTLGGLSALSMCNCGAGGGLEGSGVCDDVTRRGCEEWCRQAGERRVSGGVLRARGRREMRGRPGRARTTWHSNLTIHSSLLAVTFGFLPALV